jgi:hypothetical protein
MPTEDYPKLPDDQNKLLEEAPWSLQKKMINEHHRNPGFRAQVERASQEGKSAGNHAENWLNNTEHLHDKDSVLFGRKIIEQSKKGYIHGGHVNTQMSNIFGATYPEFDPADVPMNIPNHLGDQFK